MALTIPATCGATSMPWTGLKVPIAGMRRTHVSVVASAATTVAAGCFMPAMKVLIIAGLKTNWK